MERLEREPTRLPSLRMVAAGLAAVVVAILWPAHALSVVVVIGGLAALAVPRWPVRALGFALAAVGVVATLAAL